MSAGRCILEMNVFTKMKCPETGKEENQIKVRGSEDGVYLRCEGCGKVRGYEIGYFADKFSV